jgi:hypothetical protein
MYGSESLLKRLDWDWRDQFPVDGSPPSRHVEPVPAILNSQIQTESLWDIAEPRGRLTFCPVLLTLPASRE